MWEGWCCPAERGTKAHGSKYLPRTVEDFCRTWDQDDLTTRKAVNVAVDVSAAGCCAFAVPNDAMENDVGVVVAINFDSTTSAKLAEDISEMEQNLREEFAYHTATVLFAKTGQKLAHYKRIRHLTIILNCDDEVDVLPRTATKKWKRGLMWEHLSKRTEFLNKYLFKFQSLNGLVPKDKKAREKEDHSPKSGRKSRSTRLGKSMRLSRGDFSRVSASVGREDSEDVGRHQSWSGRMSRSFSTGRASQRNSRSRSLGGRATVAHGHGHIDDILVAGACVVNEDAMDHEGRRETRVQDGSAYRIDNVANGMKRVEHLETFPALSGLRFCLACWVVFRHVGKFESEAITKLQGFSLNMLGFCWIAGFMLAYSLRATPIPLDARRKFYVMRIAIPHALFLVAAFFALPSFVLRCSPGTCGTPDHLALYGINTLIQFLVFSTGWMPLAAFNYTAWFQTAYYFWVLCLPCFDGWMRPRNALIDPEMDPSLTRKNKVTDKKVVDEDLTRAR